MTSFTFPATGPIRINATVRASDLEVTTGAAAPDETEVLAAPDGDTTVSDPGITVILEPRKDNAATRSYIDESVVEFDGEELTVTLPRTSSSFFGSAPRLRVKITAPAGSDLEATSGSGDISADGRLGAVRVKSGSGDVSVESADATTISCGSGGISLTSLTDGDLATGSGDVAIDRASGSLNIKSGSGDITVNAVEDLTATTASGDFRVGTLGGDGRLRTASGDIQIRTAIRGEISAISASGDVQVGVRTGTAVLLDCASASGDVHSDLSGTDAPADTEERLELHARSASGDIVVRRSA